MSRGGADRTADYVRAVVAVGAGRGPLPCATCCRQRSITNNRQIQTQTIAAVRSRRGAPPARPPLPRLPASRLPVLENPDAGEVQLETARFGDQPLWRFL